VVTKQKPKGAKAQPESSSKESFRPEVKQECDKELSEGASK